jgi:hypothetical protein
LLAKVKRLPLYQKVKTEAYQRLEALIATRVYNHESARRLHALADSAEFAAAHMKDAVAAPLKGTVMGKSLEAISLEGLPENWFGDFTKGRFHTEGKLPQVRPNVTLHKGWFDQTLPDFVADHPGPIAFLHVDCDLYSSTKTIFQFLGDRLVPGTVILFDEYFNYPGWRDHEHRAFTELVEERGLKCRWLAYITVEWNAAVQIVA